MQEFTTTDRLRLEVYNDPGAGHVHNYVPNPRGDLGGWGWLSPVENTVVELGSDGSTILLETKTAQSGVYFTTEAIPRKTGATHLTMAFGRKYGDATVGVKGRVDFYDAAGALLSSTASTALLAADNTFGALVRVAIAAGTVTLKARFDLTRAGAGALNALDNVNLNTPVELYQGTLAELADPLILEDGWTQILGPTAELTVERTELNLGTLTATIYSPELDPAVADTIRKGKPIRLLADLAGEAAGEYLFTGEILNATVDYDLAHPDPDKRTKITLTAVDPTNRLAAIPRPDGVSSIAELAYVLEGCGLPWELNGVTGHAATTPPIVTRNANAKAIDQVAIVRDTALGYAWVDRAGVVQAWDVADLAGRLTPAWERDLTEDVYADVTVDYDLDRCINIVTLKYLRLDPVTGDTEEVAYGPFVDLESREEWGPHEREFTVQGLDEDPATLAAYAQAILDANATPVRRITGATLNLRTDADLVAWARLDLYDARRCVAARAGLDLTQRVTGLRHHITAGAADSLWRLEVEFAGEDAVAPPQQVPSPPATGADSLAQRLRPVGEVTMMMGLPSQVWPGWLILNGDGLTAGEYPELEAWLAAGGLSTTVLPDFTDRIPVAAGVKALGAKTGAWTKTITAGMLPVHDHAAGTLNSTTVGDKAAGTQNRAGNPINGRTANASYSGTPANDLDITPRVFGLYFVIRARSGA